MSAALTQFRLVPALAMDTDRMENNLGGSESDQCGSAALLNVNAPVLLTLQKELFSVRIIC